MRSVAAAQNKIQNSACQRADNDGAILLEPRHSCPVTVIHLEIGYPQIIFTVPYIQIHLRKLT